MIKLIYSYGLQPGNSLILIAVIHVIFVFMDACIGYCEKQTWKPNGIGIIPMMVLYLLGWLVDVTCLGYGVILRGSRQLLRIWMVFQIIILILGGGALLIHWFYDYKRGDAMSMDGLYVILPVVLISGYEIHLVSRILTMLSSSSDEDPIQLEPTGKGCSHIMEHFKNDTRSAASLALMTDIILNLRKFLERHLYTYLLSHVTYEDEITRSAILTIEDTVMRYIRVGICIVGFDLIFKERKRWMFYWSFLYLASIMLSLGVFLYMIIMWRAVLVLVTVLYFVRFTFELVCRTGVLLTCFRYSDRFEPPQGFHE